MREIIRLKYVRVLALVALLLGALLVCNHSFYAKAQGKNIIVPVRQTFESESGSDGTLNGVFTYHFESVNGAPAQNDFQLTKDEKKDIELHFDEVNVDDEFEYRLEVVKGDEKGYVWDKTAYIVKIYADDTQNGVDIVTAINADTNEKEEIEFKNAYKPKICMVDPPVRKVLKFLHDRPSIDAEFKFRLAPEDPSYPMPEGSANGEKIISIWGEGVKDFGTWYYTKAGKYRYVVSEIDTNESGYTYDRTQYEYTDTVVDNGGELTSTRTYVNPEGEEEEIAEFVFRNSYDSKKETIISKIVNRLVKLVKTGDKTIILLIVLAVLIIASLIVFIIKRKSKDEEDDNEDVEKDDKTTDKVDNK